MPEETRVLINAHDYRPKIGGVSSCAFEIARALSEIEGVTPKVLAPRQSGDKDFDEASPFMTARFSCPKEAFLSIPVWTYRVQKEVAQFKPTAVLNLLWMPEAAGCALVSKVMGLPVPYYIMAHGVEILESERSLKKQIRKRLSIIKEKTFAKAAGVFAVSHYTANLVRRETKIDSNRVVYCPNGVDAKRFKPIEVPKTWNQIDFSKKFIFLSVCRLVPHKGMDIALKAFAQCSKDVPEAVYIVAGTGPDRGRLESLAEGLGIRSKVHFLGDVSDEELPNLYNLANCFVLLSREDLGIPSVEGFGIVFLESASCGVPAIAGQSGGIADAVLDGISGWLVPPNEVSVIAGRMIECAQRPEMVKEMGQSARNRAEREFTWRHTANRILEVIRSNA